MPLNAFPDFGQDRPSRPRDPGLPRLVPMRGGSHPGSQRRPDLRSQRITDLRNQPVPGAVGLSPIEEKEYDFPSKQLSATSDELSAEDTISSSSPKFELPSPLDSDIARKRGRPTTREIELDPFGLPLSPQPLRDPKDPLTWSQKRKICILIHVSIMSFLSQFLAMSIVSCIPCRALQVSHSVGICALSIAQILPHQLRQDIISHKLLHRLRWNSSVHLESSLTSIRPKTTVSRIASGNRSHCSWIRTCQNLSCYNDIPNSQRFLCGDSNRTGERGGVRSFLPT
jgi:hypothetical protein